MTHNDVAKGSPPPPPRSRPPKTPRPQAAVIAQSQVITQLRERIATLEDPEIVRHEVEAFWQAHHDNTPILEHNQQGAPTVLTFLWRGAHASAVLLFVNRISDETQIERSLLTRIDGTDVWHLSYELPAGWRGSYGFIVHTGDHPAPWSAAASDQLRLRELLDNAQLDPRNSKCCPNSSGGHFSVAELPDAPPQHWIADRLSAANAAPPPLRELLGPDGRSCWVLDLTAPGPASTATPCLWLVLDGRIWVESLGLATVLTAMRAKQELAPICAVFIDSGTRAQRWADLAEPAEFVRTLATAYVPWARELFRLTDADDAGNEGALAPRCGVVGQSLGGYAALHCATTHPQTFDRVVSQSASLWLGAPSLTPATNTAAPIPASSSPGWAQHFHIEVGTEEWALRDANRDFANALRCTGSSVELQEFVGGHDYACWRGTLPEAIAQLSV